MSYKTCKICNGTGLDSDLIHRCPGCNATGRAYYTDYHRIPVFLESLLKEKKEELVRVYAKMHGVQSDQVEVTEDTIQDSTIITLRVKK